jgi:hypothetical protein
LEQILPRWVAKAILPPKLALCPVPRRKVAPPPDAHAARLIAAVAVGLAATAAAARLTAEEIKPPPSSPLPTLTSAVEPAVAPVENESQPAAASKPKKSKERVKQPAPEATPASKIEIMSVDDVRVGMEGTGKTVLQGTEIVPFAAKILGVMKGVSPGRDIVLARLSGANLEYTGVIAGMSGSPIYIDGKLLGAVAYTWAFNKEPIAGITPFEQMRSFAGKKHHASHAMIEPNPDGSMPVAALDLTGDPFAGLKQAAEHGQLAVAARNGQMAPIAVPLSATGFTDRSLTELREHFAPLGFIPVAAGGAGADIQAAEPENPIVPGASLGASLVTGDFDLSGIGTVTHVEGNQVWGWGHPFMESGRSSYLLRSGHIHVINPKLDLSTKMGSPLSVLGVVNADVSTCIAGQLGGKPDLLPVKISLQQGPDGQRRQYQVQIIRQPELIGPLVSTVLGNALDAGGSLDQEITLNVDASIQAQGLPPIKFKNTYSGGSVAGTQGVKGLLNQVAIIADGLMRNPFAPARLDSIECHTVVTDRRTSAAITSVRLGSDEYEPGDEMVARVTLRPYKCDPEEVEIKLQLPETLPPGNYTATVCDAGAHLKSLFAEQPSLLVARSVPEVADVYRLQLDERRETLYLRVLTTESGLSLDRVRLPQLPSSMRTALESRRATPATPIRQALISRLSTRWVIEGGANLKFKVVRDKKATG